MLRNTKSTWAVCAWDAVTAEWVDDPSLDPQNTMGACSSSPESAEAKAAREKSAAIEKQLQEALKKESTKIKLLLLGAGESGKSTIFKQFQLMYGAPRSNKDLK